MFKVGDKVQILRKSYGIPFQQMLLSSDKPNIDCSPIERLDDGGYVVVGGYHFLESDLKLLTNENNMNLMEKFAIALKGEPEKSYRKAGITNGDDVLTDDGVKIFLTWMLKKNPDFKTEVVDNILEEEKEK